MKTAAGMRICGKRRMRASKMHRKCRKISSVLRSLLGGIGLELFLADLHLLGGGAAEADAGLPDLVQGGLDGLLGVQA